MCGFTGFIDGSIDKKQIIKSMNDTIIHRGPDGEGFYIDDSIAMGFRRLSIIDLSHGDQPIFNEDHTKVLNFNGEIYNYQELREVLIQRGHVFRTHSDSEVILHGYEEFGEDIVSHLRGMFAFVVYDIEEKTLFAARDHFGIKPFYYAHQDDLFIYGSEIKSFLKHPSFKKQFNKDALQPYLTFQTSVLDETFFKDVKPLLPGHTLRYSNGVINTQSYHELIFEPKIKVSKDMINDIMRDSVKAHQIADVEVGSFLSSGVDSSYIASISDVHKTFTVGFQREGFNECDEAKELASILETEHYSKVITPDEFFSVLSDIQYHADEPHSNLSAVPLYFLSKMAAEHVKVVLSGEGADELFGGYESYLPTKKWGLSRKFPREIRYLIGYALSKLSNYVSKIQPWADAFSPIEKVFIGQAMIMSEKESKSLLKKPYHSKVSVETIVAPWFKISKGLSGPHRKMHLDMNLWLNRDILTKADKMTMAHSLELRVPFLDIKVWNVAREIESSQNIDTTNTKKLFREAALEKIPQAWANRKKLGFLVPFKFWILDEHIMLWIKEKFSLQFVEELFNQEKLFSLLNKHSHSISEGRKIYTILCFILWYERYFVEDFH
jgi:asparagine synthase (glutamine-hydrolysing)